MMDNSDGKTSHQVDVGGFQLHVGITVDWIDILLLPLGHSSFVGVLSSVFTLRAREPRLVVVKVAG